MAADDTNRRVGNCTVSSTGILFISIYIFTFIIFFLTGKEEVKANPDLRNEYEKEIENYGFRTSTEGMTVEEVEDYLLVVRDCLRYDKQDNNNPFLPIMDKLYQLYMGEEVGHSFRVNQQKGDVFIGTVTCSHYGDYILPYHFRGLVPEQTTFEFIIKKNWKIEVLDDTVNSAEPDYLVTFPRQMSYHMNDYTIQEYESSWTDEESGMEFKITYPFLVEAGEETWNKWEAVNSSIRDVSALWMLELEKSEPDVVEITYSIKTLDDELFSILFTGKGKEDTYQFGATVSLRTGEILPFDAISEIEYGNDVEFSDYDYYIMNRRIYVIGLDGGTAYNGRLEYQPYHWETKVEEIYDDTGVMIGYVSFKYPVLDSDDSGAKAVNSAITEDVEQFYEEIMDTFSQAALKAADYVRDLYHQGGQEEYEHNMNLWNEWGGNYGLFISGSIVKNNYGKFGIKYELSGTGMQSEYAEESICIYQLKDGEILEGKEYLDEMVKNIYASCETSQ